jgi:hypothetical protein
MDKDEVGKITIDCEKNYQTNGMKWYCAIVISLPKSILIDKVSFEKWETNCWPSLITSRLVDCFAQVDYSIVSL